ncbi:ATP-binding cassette domain-containing protein [Plantactinospora soyae]|uniref:ATP-binding cassette subfamily B protein n=1 Tax=Plantactinospora soyae TaxID=1544732 RepID=A0A927MEP9_9ACTN|nr:ABC transporter ATP-binding protein [Plantactinospora soyae]MBE1491736.1 ATP-binding cassette subfamily B protein [Plantactinospora soyae]
MIDWLRLLRHVTRLTVRADRRAATVLCTLMIGQAGVIAAVGLSQRWLVDSSAAHQVAAVVGAIALGAAAYGLSSGAGRVQSNLIIYLVGRVRMAFNEEIQQAVSSIPTITHVEYGPYINRWDRIFKNSQSIAGMPWSTLDATAAVGSLAVTIGLLGWVSPALCLLALLAVPVFLASRRADRLLRDARDAGMEILRRERRLHELCVEPEPAKEVMLAGSGATLSRHASGLWDEAVALETGARLRAAAYSSGAWLLYAAGVAAALVVVADLIRSGRTTVGAAVMVVSLATQLQSQLRTVLTSLNTVAEAGQAVEHYSWLRRYAAEAARPGTPAPAVLTRGITLHDVRFRYPTAEHDVLHGVNLHLPAGSTVAVVGVNGAGKSTLIKLLTGVYEPTAGYITVDDEPLADIARDRWQASLSGVFQDFARIRLLARETVGVGDVRHIRDRPTVEAAVDRAGAADVLARLPQRLDTQLGAAFGGVEPSLGQWQRLALARSLMREVAGDRPPLCVVLDEPTAALDPLAEHDLFQHFVQQVRAATRQGAVTVLVSHRFTTVRMADLIVVLEDGRVAEFGSHAELMAAGRGYAELYRLQERAYR